MREIKFRAWDVNRLRWLTVEEMKLYNFGEDVSVFRGVRFCQFTGLKDKNGVEIFEGDIVRGQEHMGETYAPFKRFGVVVFKKGCFFYEINAQPHQVLYALLNPEIIGNLYENPSLLSPKKSEEA